MGLNLIGCSIVAVIFIIGATKAREYNVGDSFGWNVPTNESFYSDWASTKRFLVGDTLVFNWTGEHTLAFGADDNCNTTLVGPLYASYENTNESVWKYTPDETGPRYFLCTIGNHCARGQKFKINVESLTSDAPNSSPPIQSFGILIAFVSSLFAHRLITLLCT